MIKVANNIQRMLNKKAAERNIPPYIARPMDADRLAPENFYARLQGNMQLRNRLMNRDLNSAIAGLHQGYSNMVGPDGIPLLLSRAGQFATDTQTAVPMLAQDYNNTLNMQTQAINQMGGIGGNALNYVEANIPEAQRHARNTVDAGMAGLDQIEPQLAARQQALQNQAQSLGGKLKSIGQGLLKNPLGR